MTAGTSKPHHRFRALRGGAVLLVLASCAGCSGMRTRHEADKIPQLGVVDPHQARELQKVSLPTYVIEPPDELDVTVRPSTTDSNMTSVTVRPVGVIDLGFAGDVYVAGLTLTEAERKIAQQLTDEALARNEKIPKPYEVSVRLAGAQSKYYYVLGAVSNQGRFKLTGNETVLDAILQAGLRPNSLPNKAYLSRPSPVGAQPQVLSIDWTGIKDRGDTLTNYQLFPGDRVVVPGTKPPGLMQSLLGG
jgi:polysaccharide export outer membrane protein